MINTRITETSINKIYSLSKSFLWGGIESQDSLGGLRLRDLLTVKSFLVTKRILPILNKDQNLWTKILMAKYDTTPHPWNIFFKGTFLIWKNIV